MGLVLGRFRKKRTTIEVLEDLDKRIKEMEKRRISTEQTHRVVIGRLMLYSVGAYVIAAFIFYFFFFPASLSEQIFYITPLLIFPVIVVLVRRGVMWYFKRQITSSESKLAQMEKEKQEILEEVMDKETYKTAKQILERFAPKKELAVVSPLPSKSASASVQGQGSISPSLSPSLSGTDLRRRPLKQRQPPLLSLSQQPLNPPKVPSFPTVRPQSLPHSGPLPLPAPVTGHHPGRFQGTTRMPPGPPTPRPIAPRERTVVDRLVDFLIADGPSNRYALICKQCKSHNGLALKEEFEFVSFRCCYCFTFNPARKMRLSPPRIEDIDHSTLAITASDTPASASTTPTHGDSLPILTLPSGNSSEGPTDSESEKLSKSDTTSDEEEDVHKRLPPPQTPPEALVHPALSAEGDTESRGFNETEEKEQETELGASELGPAENGDKQLSSGDEHKVQELSAAE